MRREHEETERPFDPEKPPTWRGSSSDLVANGPRLRENPDRFFDELNELVERYGRTLRTDPEEVKRELNELFGGRGNAFKKLRRADELLEGHGVESLGERYSYINFGDTYDPTIIYDGEEDKFFISTWGDVEQQRAQGAEEDAWGDWIEGEFTNRLEALCEDKPQALAALEAIPEEKLESLFREALRETPNAEIVHESDGSVFVSKFEQVVRTAYRLLESGKFKANARGRRRNSRATDLEDDPNYLFTELVPAPYRGDDDIEIFAFDQPKKHDRHHFGMEIEVRQGDRVIFPRGQLYGGTPKGWDRTGDRSREHAIFMAAMKPGDTDDEFFDDANYTPGQRAWAEKYGDELSLYGEEQYGER
jgi:hypothetical protein